MTGAGTAPERETRSLPDVIPIFPLSGAVLLPRAELPLNIFEPRYLRMVDDAQAGHGLIGMIQPRPGGDRDRPDLYDTGCVGRITHMEPTQDGRQLITLFGINRFHVADELAAATPYRQIQADYTAFAHDRVEDLGSIDRDKVLATLRRFLARLEHSADWSVIEATGDERLINALTQICPFAPAEKQALVEAPTLPERAQTLQSLMEIATHSDEGAGGPVN